MLWPKIKEEEEEEEEGGVGFQAIFPLVRIPHRQEEGGLRAIGVKGPRILHTVCVTQTVSF